MKIKALLILLLPLILCSWTDDPSSAFQSSLLEARLSAEKKDQPYMIIFQADWCTPCQWMDKFTLNDPRVQQALRDNYSAVKMDIDEFEGFALKEQHQVKLLPTILFFDRNNEVIGRYENTYDVDDFLRILTIHKDFSKKRSEVLRSPSSPMAISADNRMYYQSTTTTASAHHNHTTATTTSRPRDPMRRPVQTPTQSSSPSFTTSSYTTQTTNVLSDQGLTVQLGAFNNYHNAEALMNKMVRRLGSYPSIRIRQINHKKYPYRVIIGDYYTQEEAFTQLMTLDNQGIKGLLKRKSEFK